MSSTAAVTRCLDLSFVVADLLQSWCQAGGELTREHPSYWEFCNDPRMEFHEFVTQLFRRSGCADQTLVLALVYVARLCGAAKRLYTVNLRRVFTVALILADKWMEDHVLRLSDWSALSGFPLDKLKSMEIEALKTLSYLLYCAPEQYFAAVCSVQKQELTLLPPFPLEQQQQQQQQQQLTRSLTAADRHGSDRLECARHGSSSTADEMVLVAGAGLSYHSVFNSQATTTGSKCVYIRSQHRDWCTVTV